MHNETGLCDEDKYDSGTKRKKEKNNNIRIVAHVLIVYFDLMVCV